MVWVAVAAMMLVASPGVVARIDVVSQIRVEAPGLEDAAGMLEVLGVRVGEPLDRSRLRGGIHALYARGEVEYVKVSGVATDDGIELAVRLDLRPRLALVQVQAPARKWRRRARRWLALEPGQAISTSNVEHAARRIRRELVARGYPRGSVQPFLDLDRGTNQVVLTVSVELGEADRLHTFGLVGVDPEAAAAVTAAIGDVTGEQVGDRFVDRLRRRVEREMRGLGYWEATVLDVERRLQDGGLDLGLRVAAGPRYELALAATRGGDELLRSVMPDLVEGDLHPSQTEILAEQVREALQEKGYLLAAVEAEVESTGRQRILRVTADVGGARQVEEVEFRGASGIDPDSLRRVVQVRRGRGGGWRRQRVSDRSLEIDRLAVIDEYLRRGYAEVEVDRAVIEPIGFNGVRVVFAVNEGRSWLLSDLRYEGFPADVAPALEGADQALAEAGPWDARQLEAERRRLELLLTDVGFPDSRIDVEVDTREPGSARVVLRAEPGPYVHIGEIVVDGLARTRVSVVRRTLAHAGVSTGAPFSRSALLEAQRKLYELALFQRVEIDPVPGQERSPRRGLVVRCEEGAQRSYLLGLGWDTTALTRVTLGWSHLNLFGGAHAVSVETRLSEREQRFQASLREPRVPLLGEPGYVVAYRTEERLATYSQLRRGLWFDVGDRRRRPFRPWLRYEYQIVAPDAPDEILSDLEREDQEIGLASLTPTLEWDTRDDLLVPQRGFLASASLEYAFPAFQAKAHFLKLITSFTLYGELPEGTFAVGARVGLMRPVNPGPDQPQNLQIPLNARFFAGGTVSHRAFRTDYLGIEGQTLVGGEPVGGNALVLVNAEVRRPIRGVLSGVLFVDVGNVWAEPDLVDADDLRWGAGLGVHYDTPAGPLRMEYGWKLGRLEGESPGELYLSFGVAF